MVFQLSCGASHANSTETVTDSLSTCYTRGQTGPTRVYGTTIRPKRSACVASANLSNMSVIDAACETEGFPFMALIRVPPDPKRTASLHPGFLIGQGTFAGCPESIRRVCWTWVDTSDPMSTRRLGSIASDPQLLCAKPRGAADKAPNSIPAPIAPTRVLCRFSM